MKKAMKVAMCAVFAAGALWGQGSAAAEEKDPNEYADYGAATRSVKGNPMAVEWHAAEAAKIEAATKDCVLAGFVKDAASAEALLAKIGAAYDGDPIVLTQIAAVTQWVMLPDPWWCIFWDGEHAAGRKVWVAALEEAARKNVGDGYVKTFCRQQLQWCGY